MLTRFSLLNLGPLIEYANTQIGATVLPDGNFSDILANKWCKMYAHLYGCVLSYK